MSTVYRQLAQGLAPTAALPADSPLADARELARWVETLPLANTVASARSLAEVLRQLLSARMDAAARFEALEVLRRPIGQIVDSIERQIVGASFPLPPAKAQMLQLAREFHRDLACAYRMTVVDYCRPDGRVPFLRGRTVATALQRALEHLGAELAKGYLTYAAPPPGLWATAHALYRFAAEQRLDDRAVPDPLAGSDGSVQASYVHMVLLSMSNPYRLSQREMIEASAATRAWSARCGLRPAGAAAPPRLAASQDAHRVPDFPPDERVGAEDLPTLDLTALEAELERVLTQNAGLGGPLSFAARGAQSVAISADLVRRLMAAWHRPAERGQPRLPAQHELETLIGLHAVHYHLAGEVDFESFVRRICGTASRSGERAATWAANAVDAGRPEVMTSVVQDQSLGGYRLSWPGAAAVRARVGEVVALALGGGETPERDWMVGMIRWLRVDAGGTMEAGIELLGRQARPAALRALDHNGHPRPSVRALRIDGAVNGAGTSGYSVLVPSVLERGAPRYELRSAPERYAEDNQITIDLLPSLQVLEQPGAYLRLAAH